MKQDGRPIYICNKLWNIMEGCSNILFITNIQNMHIANYAYCNMQNMHNVHLCKYAEYAGHTVHAICKITCHHCDDVENHCWTLQYAEYAQYATLIFFRICMTYRLMIQCRHHEKCSGVIQNKT